MHLAALRSLALALASVLFTSSCDGCGGANTSPGDGATDAMWPDGCGPQPNGLFRVCVSFPTGMRVHDVPPVEDSFGDADPPAGTTFADTWSPRPGECSAATHDRYWVRGTDGRVYRTWHPPNATDVESGAPCDFGHEHGNDPRASPLYAWAAGVPFGIVNHAANLSGHHRHEDHFGHKVVVQNFWPAVIGNPPDDASPITLTGFHCYWLSKVHQGTHSGDALGNNEHEYQNAVMCDDGAFRNPDVGRELNAGREDHTESAVKTLTTWGHPGWFEACDARTHTDVPGGGRDAPMGADTHREIPCAHADQAFFFKQYPTEIVSTTGDADFAPRDAGISELWKPWMTIVDRAGQTLYTSSAYYLVRNPARLYNDGSFVPLRDVNGDGALDNWIPTLEVCLAIPENMRSGQCAGLPTFPSSVATTSWWQLPESPFNGTIRGIHPKGTDVFNAGTRSEFCTDYVGQETNDDPMPDADGVLRCPDGQLFQRIATTWNLWFGNASWGTDENRGGIVGSALNARSDTLGSGFAHEWVRFFAAPGVHAPN